MPDSRFVALSRRPDFVSALLLSAMIVAMLALLAVEAGRGLGFGDEGIYLLAPRYPDEIRENVSTIYRFGGYVFSLVGYNPIYYRLAGVMLIVGSALLLAVGVAGVRPWFAGHRTMTTWDRLLMPLTMLVGSLLHYQWSYLTPSYYTFTAVAVNVLTGLTLLCLSSFAGADRRYRSWGLIYGFAFGIVLFAKFPTAFALLAMTAVAVAFCGKPLRAFALAGWVSGGFLCWLLVTFFIERAPELALRDFLEGWKLYQSLGSYNPVDKLIAYPTEVGVLLLTGAALFLPSFLVLATTALNFRSRGFPLQSNSGRLVLAWVIIAAILVTVPSGLFVDVPERLVSTPHSGITRFYIAAQLGWILLLGGVVLVAYGRSIRQLGMKRGIVLFFLLGAPLAGSLGTSNPIYNVIQFYAAPWFALILALLWLLVRREFVTDGLVRVVCLAVCAYATSNVMQGSWRQPAQIKPRAMATQSVPTPVGNPSVTMLLDADTSRIITEIRAAAFAHGFKAGDDIIAFKEIPGLVFAVGGRSPGHPVFPCCRAGANEYAAIALSFADPQRLKNAFLLLDVDPQPNVRNLLGVAGLNFPSGYDLVATGNGFRLYKPTAAAQHSDAVASP